MFVLFAIPAIAAADYETSGYDGGYDTSGYDGGYDTSGYDGGYDTAGYSCQSQCYTDDQGVKYSYDEGFGGDSYGGGSFGGGSFGGGSFGGESFGKSGGGSFGQSGGGFKVTSPSYSTPKFASSPPQHSYPISYPQMNYPIQRPIPSAVYPPIFPTPVSNITSNNCVNYSCNDTTVIDNSINGSFNDNSVNDSFNTVVAKVTPVATKPPYYPVQYVFPPAPPPAPSVSLSQIPYTGLDLGAFGSAAYWLGLVAFAGASAYLLLYYKGGASVLLPSILGLSVAKRTFAGPVSAPARVQRATDVPTMFSNQRTDSTISPQAVNSEQRTVRAELKATRTPKRLPVMRASVAPRDSMTLVHSSDGESPRIVITRG